MSRTFANIAEHPLQWPSHISRKMRPESSRFQTTLFKALENVKGSLQKLASDSGKKIANIIISSNYSLTNTNPEDAGVCVYFVWDGVEMCYPIDRYNKVQDNLQAIYHIIEADRTKLRHGSFEFIMAEKRGETLMLNQSGATKPWYEVLGVDKTAHAKEVAAAYRQLAKIHHPDKSTGNKQRFQEINTAFDYFKQSIP